MTDNAVTESEKSKFFKRFGIDRATRNIVSYGIFGATNLGLITVGAFSGGTIPIGYAIGATALNGLAHFLKTNKHMDSVLEENKALKENVTRLIDVKSSTPSDSVGQHPRIPSDEEIFYPDR